jgi:TetR/AcrR family transcriptional regulator, copper-responsive repressor
MKNTSATSTRGRPRQFDREKALAAAMRLFWEHGFAGTSMSDLQAAMNINPPSLYAAFGDKRALFEASIDHYQAGCGSFAVRALAEEITARAAIERLLREAAQIFSDPALPHGCMVVCSAINGTPDDEPIQLSLQKKRKQSEQMIRKRIERGIADGDVLADCDAVSLASYVTTVFQGLSIQARDGANKKTLDAVVKRSMQAWPAEN